MMELQNSPWQDLLSLPYVQNRRTKCMKASKDSLSFLQRMSLLRSLDSHRGCVNSLQWNETGQYILSGSDDHRLIITEPYTGKVRTDLMTSHRANIFSAKFLPGTSDRKIVSCAGDGNILFTDLERLAETMTCTFTCHPSHTYELLTVAGDPNSFLSCGEDGTVRWFDLRTKESCNRREGGECNDDVMIRCSQAVTAMSFNPMLPYYLAVGSSDSAVRIFDRRMLSIGGGPAGSGDGGSRCLAGLVSKYVPVDFEGKKRRITSIDYRPDGQEVLVSYSSDYIYIFDPKENDESRTTRLYVGRKKKQKESKEEVKERSDISIKILRVNMKKEMKNNYLYIECIFYTNKKRK